MLKDIFRYKHLVILSAVAVLIIGFFMTSHVYAKDDVIRVAYYPKAPFYVEKNDEITGYNIDYLREIAKYTNWSYEFVKAVDAKASMELLAQGKADFVISEFKMEEFENEISYGEQSTGFTYHALLALEEREDLIYEDFEKISQLTIGYEGDTVSLPELNAYANQHGIGLNLVNYENQEKLTQALENGEIDAMYDYTYGLTDRVKMIAAFNIKSFYCASAKGNENLVQKADEAIADSIIHNANFKNNLQSKYLFHINEIPFSKAELDFCASSEPISIGLYSDRGIISFIDNDTGKIRGVTKDVLEKISSITGLTFEYQKIETKEQARTYLEEDKVDAIASCYIDGMEPNFSNIYFTKPFMRGNLCFYAKENLEFNAKELYRVAVTSDLAMHAEYLAKEYPHFEVVEYFSHKEVMDVLQEGGADLGFQDFYLVNQLIALPQNDNVKVIDDVFVKENHCIAVHSDANPLLLSALNKSIDKLDMQEITEIALNYMTEEQPFEFQTFMMRYPLHMAIVFSIVIGLIICGLFFIDLSRLKAKQNANLRRLNKELKNTVAKTEQTIEQVKAVDSLTGLYTFERFKKIAQTLLEEKSNGEYYILHFNIKKFKYLNQIYTIPVGDRVLKEIGQTIKSMLANGEYATRVSADRFAAVMYKKDGFPLNLANMKESMEAIKKKMRLEIPLEMIIGIYKVEDTNEQIESMLDKAISAQRSISKNSDEIFAFYTKELAEQIEKETKIEREMEAALINGEFKPYYQPKVILFNEEVVGAEALVRWIKEDGSIICPDDFIPIFEKNGFINQLDIYILEQTCAYIRKREDAGLRRITISVNQSREVLVARGYFEKVTEIVNKYQIPENMIEIEITESVYLEQKDVIISITSRLQEMGVKVSIDDFGSGYSALSMVSDLYMDELKIDRDFFMASKNIRARAIIEVIVQMAHTLGMTVVCEGVETKEQVEFLSNIGCDKAQGYYYSKPIPQGEFEALLKQINK